VTKASHLPIRYFLALLWAHPILHVSGTRLKMPKLLRADTGRQHSTTNSVEYECGVGRSTEKWLCQFPRNDLVALLDIALHYFISTINWVNKTTNKKEIIKTKCDSVNHTSLPVRGSPTRLSASGQQSYEGWSFRLLTCIRKVFYTTRCYEFNQIKFCLLVLWRRGIRFSELFLQNFSEPLYVIIQ
jgi:hypothetical protein